MKRTLLKAAVAVAVAAMCGATYAQAPREIRMATQNPKGHPIVTGMEKFAEIVAARSDGRIKVNLFPGGVLGGDAQNVSALQGGTIDMVVLNAGILASQVKDYEVFDLPFMFATAQQADAVLDGPFGQQMLAKLDDKKIHGLAFWELGFRQITNSKRAITKVDDIAGLKLRVIPNAINIDWVKALGANPTPLAFGEVYQAMEQKAIDGQENPLPVIAANRFYEVQKHVALTNHQYNPQIVIASRKLWDGLSEADRKVVADAARESAVFQRKVSRDAVGTALETVKSNGMQVSELSPAEQARMREKLKPVIDKHGAAMGETVKMLQAELAKARQ